MVNVDAVRWDLKMANEGARLVLSGTETRVGILVSGREGDSIQGWSMGIVNGDSCFIWLETSVDIVA